MNNQYVHTLQCNIIRLQLRIVVRRLKYIIWMFVATTIFLLIFNIMNFKVSTSTSNRRLERLVKKNIITSIFNRYHLIFNNLP